MNQLTRKLRFPKLSLGLALAAGLAGQSGQLAAASVADFELPSVSGAPSFKLSEHRGHYVALHFLLKTECPFCLGHVQEVARKASLLPNVIQVFIKPDSEEVIKDWMAKISPGLKDKVTLYRDADAALAQRFGIRDGYPFHGELVHYPALILIGPKGDEAFRYVGKSNSDRFSFAQLSAKLDELEPNRALAEYNLPKDGLAIAGYDPVAYFTEGQARKGEVALQARFRGVNYRFASQKSLDQFIARPEMYVPTYGGWCATAMAKGEKVEVDPANFKVSGGRLYLFYKGLWGNARKDWDKDEPAQIAKADAAWKQLSGE